MHKDMFGRVVEVGDVVCWSGASSGVEIAVVTQLMPKTIKINNGGSIYAQYTVIINEQMDASGKGERLEKMREEYKEHFDLKKPIVRAKNPTFRYSVVFVGDPTTKKMCVVVSKLPHDNNTQATKSWRQVETELKARGFIFHQNSISYHNSRGYDSLRFGREWKLSNDYYGPYQEMLLREIKAIGLEPYIDQIIDIDMFKNTVASQITGLKYPDYFK